MITMTTKPDFDAITEAHRVLDYLQAERALNPHESIAVLFLVIRALDHSIRQTTEGGPHD